MGNSASSTGQELDKALASDLPEHERYFGLDNFGNTCYCNSVLQALYFCEPFRKALIEYRADKNKIDNLHRNIQANASSTGTTGAAPFVNGDVATNQHNTLQPMQQPLHPQEQQQEQQQGQEQQHQLQQPQQAHGNGNSSGSQFRLPLRGIMSGNQDKATAASTKTSGAARKGGDTEGASLHGANNEAAATASETREEESMLSALTDLFIEISAQKKRTGSLPPKSFITTLRRENDLFSGYQHQDAHEFLNFMLNDVTECLQRDLLERKRRKLGMVPRPLKATKTFSNSNIVGMDTGEPPQRTFVQELFEGRLTNEVRCLCCESIAKRDEAFLDLSVDVEQNSSVSACLKNFSSTETLRGEEKFHCDFCGSLQEAERRMYVNVAPRVLALHLKRFKYVEQLQKLKKLSYRVVFPLELRIETTNDEGTKGSKSQGSCLYDLFGVVVHVGSGPNHGHYVSLIKSYNQWLLFDDECVELKDESELQNVFGLTQEVMSSTETGYILFYQAK
ncbi:Ubiquitin carboxyl-terminal hydrolase 4 [Porphyridium purpureum]|uniref:Ubiquitin carboxyl-terminal hydrolase n=1 Tax=Porphyridium purpureum TaxID=35688 RepID=A0A5J4YW98_PORPP|nr:Ubiquitin carboxyl-terminal hydrolase 4 [Porphyridium purpureum]|eukprot:POR2335..scf209_3